MTVLSSYFDASGTQTEGPVLVVAGAISDVEDWTTFDERRLDAMELSGVKHFRMHDFAHFKNEYQCGWRDFPRRRTAFLSDLISLINETVQRTYVTTLVLDHYAEINRKYQATEFFGGAYAIATANCLMRVLEWAKDAYPDGKMGFFIEQGDIGQDAFMRFMRDQIDELANSIHLESKTDGQGEDLTPFHVPDFVAYEYRSEHGHYVTTGAVKETPRGSLTALRASVYPHAGVLNYEALERICQKAKVPLR